MSYFPTTLGGTLDAAGSIAGIAGNVASLFGGGSKGGGGGGFRRPINTPTYTFGGGNLLRANQDIQNLANQQRGLIGGLRDETKPGFGRLTDAGVNAIRNRAAAQVGNLRAQQAKRGLSGASFANNELSNLQLAYDQAEQEFRAQAFQQEMAAQVALLDRDYQLLESQTQRELGELGLATGFLARVNQALQNQKTIKQAVTQNKLISGLSSSVNDSGSRRAAGGPVKKKKRYLVGELGPEIFEAPADGRIISNQQSFGNQGGSAFKGEVGAGIDRASMADNRYTEAANRIGAPLTVGNVMAGIGNAMAVVGPGMLGPGLVGEVIAQGIDRLSGDLGLGNPGLSGLQNMTGAYSNAYRGQSYLTGRQLLEGYDKGAAKAKRGSAIGFAASRYGSDVSRHGGASRGGIGGGIGSGNVVGGPGFGGPR